MRSFTVIPLIVVASMLLMAGYAAAGCAPDTIWMNAYGAGGEYMVAVHNTPEGGLILGGNTTTYGAGNNDFWLVKLDADGDTVWTRTYGSSGEDDLLDMRVVPAGGYILAGSRQAELSTNTDIWVVRTDANGDTLWAWAYGDPVEAEWAGSVVPMANGDFAVAATYATADDGPTNIALYLLDSDGNPYDSEYFGGMDDDETAMTIRQTPDGGFIIVGWTRSFGLGPDDVYLVKTDDTGALDWQKWYGGAGADEGRDVIITSDGSYVIVGNTSSYGAGGADFYIIKTNSMGDTLWTRAVGGTEYDIADGVVEASDGTIAVVGETESYGSGDLSVYIVALDGNGNVHCTDTYGTDGLDDGVAIVETPDQGFVIVGGTAPGGTYNWSGLALRVYGQAPIIHSIPDVPYDQGGQVRLVWGRSSHDAADGNPVITGYAIYRKYDWAAVRTRCPAAEKGVSDLGYPPGDWDYVTTVPARCEDIYSTVVPTLCDSSASEGICWSFFFVSALTEEPGFYFDSPVDSGYSVDNLAPSPPTNLHMPTATDLAWDEAPEEDFDYFTVYGSASPDFGPAAWIGYTVDPGLDVSGDRYAYYYVTATDIAGNEGDPASVENVYASVSGSIPRAYALRQNGPNPFHAITTIAFDLPVAGRVRLDVMDVGGRVVRTLVRGAMPAGAHSVTWDGCDDAGASVGPGVYFVRMSAGDFTADSKTLLLR
jgi:hypothetical protein